MVNRDTFVIGRGAALPVTSASLHFILPNIISLVSS